jgi:hypothetical protein
MSTFRIRSLLAFLVLLTAVPYTTYGAGLFPTSIVPGPDSACYCPGSAPSWGCILLVLQNALNVLVGLGILFCVMWIAYAGFSMMTSGGVAEARSMARTRILNSVIGILVILTAWLLIDFVMKAVYNPDTAFQSVNFGPWHSLLGSEGGDYCLQVNKNPTGLTSGWIAIATTANTGPYTGGSNQLGVAHGLCADSNTSCSVTAMKGEGLSEAEAQAMSCIAVTESSGGADKGNSGTGAVGLFQITGQNWNVAKYHKGQCSAGTSRLNDTCNRQTAVLMYKDVGYQPWTGKCNSARCGNVTRGQYWNPNAVACVKRYDPSHPI